MRRGLTGRPGNPTNDVLIAEWTDRSSGCWEWLGSRSPEGYGRVRDQYVHRVSYELHVGPIPDGFQIDHLCRNRICCNPDHLEAVTQTENVRRAFDVPTCKYGHEWTPETTGYSNGRRSCIPCKKKWHRDNYRRLAAAGREPLEGHEIEASKKWARCECGWEIDASSEAARYMAVGKHKLAKRSI